MTGLPREDVTFAAKARRGRTQVEGPHRAELGFSPETEGNGSRGGAGVSWKWDGTELVVQNDCFGFFPVFYRGSGESVTISNHLLSVVKRTPTPTLDDRALAVFLRVGYFIGNRTAFEGIRVLPPGSKLTWVPGKLTLECEPFPEAGWRTPPSPDRAITIYGELFQQAVVDLIPPPDAHTALPLSGGRDSRHILLALRARDRLPDVCVTMRHFAPTPDEDAAVAEILARRVGAHHVILSPPKRRLEAELQKNVATHFLADEHAWMLPLGSYLHEHQLQTSYDGIAGDVLSAGLFLTKERLELYSDDDLVPLANHLLGSDGYLPKLLTENAYRRWNRDLAVEELVEELEVHRSAQNPVGQFFFWNRTRREIAAGSWGILGRAAKIVAPYMHQDVYGFLNSLPADYFLDQTFHDKTIHIMYPEFRDIPYENPKSPRRIEGRMRVLRYVVDAGHFLRPRPGRERLLASSFILPRLAWALANPRYGTVLPEVLWRAVYLTQVREALRSDLTPDS